MSALARFRKLAAFAALSLACGRTGLELSTEDTEVGAGATPAAGGTAGAGAVPPSAAGTAPNAAGATTSRPDFDFTPVLDQATAYQIHPSHSGSQQTVTITPPLTRIWSLSFELAVSYPLLVDARVFVATNLGDENGGLVVRALAAATGATLWTFQPSQPDAGSSALQLAYDRGQVFAVSKDGAVVALDAATGAVGWRASLPALAGSVSLPVAAGGALFVGATTGEDDYTLFVLDERDGHVVYTVARRTGGDPTLSTNKVFSTGACDYTVALDAPTGNVLWNRTDQCVTGGPTRTMIHAGVLWVPASDGGLNVIDENSGTSLGELDEPNPLFQLSAANDQVVLPSFADDKYALRVFGATGGAFRWQVALPARPVLPAIVTPNTAFVLAGSDDKFLYAIDLGTRQLAWQSSDPAAPADDYEPTDTDPVQAMTASGGRIIVAFGRSLSAFAALN